MLLYRGIVELSIFIGLLLSKELLFYGEERLIAVCYLYLFFLGFFNLYQGVVNDFSARANAIKEELDSYFYNIIETLLNTRKFIKVSFDIFYNFLVLYRALLAESNFYFLYHYNSSNLKRFLINYKALTMLENTNKFFWDIKSFLVKTHSTKFLSSEFARDHYNIDLKVNNYNKLHALLSKHIAIKQGAKDIKTSLMPYYNLDGIKRDKDVSYLF